MSELLKNILIEIELNGGLERYIKLILKENYNLVKKRNNHRHSEIYTKSRQDWSQSDISLMQELKACGYSDSSIGVCLGRTRPAILDKRKALSKQLLE